MTRLILLGLILSLTACAPVISQEMRSRADTKIDVTRLFHDPDAYRGKTVILGGVIAAAQNLPEGTRIEVLQKPLNSRYIPEETDISQGRFLVIHDGYLDTAIYSSGRYITVAGEVIGAKTGTIGDMPYRYPLMKALEIHLVDSSGSGIPVFFSIGLFKSF